jgi:tripartite-type tricarboxylate transporter receptor subunit TctC
VPQNITAKLHADTTRILKLPDVQENLVKQGYGVVGSTPEEFAAFLSGEHDKWGNLIKSAGLKAD